MIVCMYSIEYNLQRQDGYVDKQLLYTVVEIVVTLNLTSCIGLFGYIQSV